MREIDYIVTTLRIKKKEKPTVPLAGLVDDWPLDTRVF